MSTTVTPQRPRPSNTVGAPARRHVASQLLKKAGLMNLEDTNMRDTKTARSTRSRATLQQRAMEAVKERSQLLNGRRATTSTPSRIPLPADPRRRTTRKILGGGASAVAIWRSILLKRYNAEAQYLNLDNLIADDEFIKAGIPLDKSATSRELQVLFKLASHLTPPPITVSLAGNKFGGALCLAALYRYLPNLVNLSLVGNAVKSYHDLELQIGPKWTLKRLRELVLADTPLRDAAEKGGKLDAYQSEVLRRFPSLELLDGIPVPRVLFDIAPTTPPEPLSSFPTRSFTTTVKPSIVDDTMGPFVLIFLQRYFAAFDTNRTSLHPVYTPVSTFSFSYDSTIPARGKLRGFQHKLPNQKRLDWRSWHDPGSRNLMKTTQSMEENGDMLWTGTDDIMVGLGLLPSTRHDVSEGEKFVVDAFQMEMGGSVQLFITIHGEFVQQPGEVDGIRSFDRSMILVPAPEGSSAKQAGWDALILSDQLNVRQYSSHDAWTPGRPLLTQDEAAEMKVTKPAAPSSVQASQPAQPNAVTQSHPLLADLFEQQQHLVIELSKQTTLNFQYARMCLEANNWDIIQARKNFESLVNGSEPTLPPEAFIQS